MALVVDCSVTPGVNNYQYVKDFMVNVVSSLNIKKKETHVGAVRFGNEAHVEFHLSEFIDTQSLFIAIRGMSNCGGNTNMTGGLRLTRTEIFKNANGDRSDVQNVIVLITDGNLTREADILGDEVRLVKSRDIRIVVVGVTNKVNETLMRSIVTDSESDYINVTDFHLLSEHVDDVIRQICPEPPSTTHGEETATTTATTATDEIQLTTQQGEISGGLSVEMIVIVAVSVTLLVVIVVSVIVVVGCIKKRRELRSALNRKRQRTVMTTNPVYRCEELEDAASVYDDIQENHYDDLNEHNIYLDVLGDETQECDQPELPGPRPEAKSQEHGYEGLKEQNPEHEYLRVLSDETEGSDKNTEAADQDQDQGTEQQEKD